MKERVLELVRLAERIGECVESLEPEDRLVLDILSDGCGEKIMRICDELSVSEPTAYRRKDRVLHRLSKLFGENDVRIRWEDFQENAWYDLVEKRVPGATAEAADLSARKISGTPNGRPMAAPTDPVEGAEEYAEQKTGNFYSGIFGGYERGGGGEKGRVRRRVRGESGLADTPRAGGKGGGRGWA